VLDERVVLDPGGQRGVGMGKRAGDVSVRWRRGGVAVGEEGAQGLEGSGEIE